MVATILRNLRESVGKSQKEIAFELGLDYKRYNHYETGRSEPDISTLILLADLYKVSVGYLIGHKETPIANGDGLTPSERDLIDCYRIASPDDRIIVDSALRKYSKKEQNRGLA